MSNPHFSFKQFCIQQDQCAMKVGTDGVLLGAWAEGGKRILDIGTGTGLVALMMAQRFTQSEVTGIEIDEAAATQARANVAASPFHNRVKIEAVSLQRFSSDAPFDAITCNPPYFDNSLGCPNDSRHTARHTSSLSFAELINHSKRLLADDGVLSLVLPSDCLAKIELECAYASMFIKDRLLICTTERKQPKRVLLTITKQLPLHPTTQTTVLMQGGQRSQWYADLTADFYLD